jgi:hypothetical protein
MTKLVLPGPDVPLTRGDDPRINSVWYQKLTAWILRANQGALGADGKLTVAVTSDTNIRFSYLGSDGVTRTANVTLS